MSSTAVLPSMNICKRQKRNTCWASLVSVSYLQPDSHFFTWSTCCVKLCKMVWCTYYTWRAKTWFTMLYMKWYEFFILHCALGGAVWMITLYCYEHFCWDLYNFRSFILSQTCNWIIFLLKSNLVHLFLNYLCTVFVKIYTEVKGQGHCKSFWLLAHIFAWNGLSTHSKECNLHENLDGEFFFQWYAVPSFTLPAHYDTWYYVPSQKFLSAICLSYIIIVNQWHHSATREALMGRCNIYDMPPPTEISVTIVTSQLRTLAHHLP